MQTLGQRLREEREKRGWTIEHVASLTRIHARYFRAIESDDPGGFPGGFFYRSFIRQYARLVDVPESAYTNEIERSLAEEASNVEIQSRVVPDRPISVPPLPTEGVDRAEETRRWIIRLAALILVMGLCTSVYFVYLHWHEWFPADKTTPEIAQVTPSEEKPQDPPPTPLPSAQQPDSTPGTSTPAGNNPSTAPSLRSTPSAEPSGPELRGIGPSTAQPASTAPAPPQTLPTQPSTSPTATGLIRLVVTATEPTWVDCFQDGRRVYSGLIRGSESRSFGASERIRIRLGNAGGATLQANGKALGAAGPRGQVRTWDITAAGANVIVPPAPPARSSSQPQQ